MFISLGTDKSKRAVGRRRRPAEALGHIVGLEAISDFVGEATGLQGSGSFNKHW